MFPSGAEREKVKRRCRWTLGTAPIDSPEGHDTVRYSQGTYCCTWLGESFLWSGVLTGTEYLADEEDRSDLSRQFPEKPSL